MFPDGKKKALTLSYDDGVEQDRRLVEILNRYGIKAAFNINSGIQTGANTWQNGKLLVRRMNVAGLPALYAGHEVAVHSLTHPHLENLDEESIRNEFEQDMLNLERIFGKKVQGMAYPYGTFNDTVVRIVQECGLGYARGIVSTRSFDIPGDLLRFQPTCHHNDEKLMLLAESFINSKPEKPQLFYLWGHSYEFEAENNWHIIEEFCKTISGRADIAYCTNAEAFGL
ncbi:MAG: polysaccharide deacetylase family protein [Treponema sp.]|jgi:peptidoglycan/xylan/chitin deacetylase (PgdA/CDA1 family)|nr:polysaccharide deacetylase family protein [Treponema sp.]